jgi:hypothetical protein
MGNHSKLPFRKNRGSPGSTANRGCHITLSSDLAPSSGGNLNLVSVSQLDLEH